MEPLLSPLAGKIITGLISLLLVMVGALWRRMEKQHDLLTTRVHELHACLNRQGHDANDWRSRTEQRLGKIEVHIEYIREKLQHV